MHVTQSGRLPYELPSWELGPKGGLLSRRVPATGLRPLAQGMREEGMWEEGMWSDAGREDGLWSDAGWATDILKRSRRPLLSSFFSFPLFLPHATTCLYPPSNRSISLQPFSSCPCPASAAAARRSCLCPVLGRRRAPTLVLDPVPVPVLPPRREPCLTQPLHFVASPISLPTTRPLDPLKDVSQQRDPTSPSLPRDLRRPPGEDEPHHPERSHRGGRN